MSPMFHCKGAKWMELRRRKGGGLSSARERERDLERKKLESRKRGNEWK